MANGKSAVVISLLKQKKKQLFFFFSSLIYAFKHFVFNHIRNIIFFILLNPCHSPYSGAMTMMK